MHNLCNIYIAQLDYQTSQVSRFDRETHDFRASKFPFITVIFRTLPYFPVY